MSWVWAPVMFVIGAIVGAVITAVIDYDNATLHDRKRWWDDE